MKTSRNILVLLLLVWQPAAQSATPMSYTFDLQIQQRIGPEASVESLVVRNSHLYFVCSDSRESVVVEADSQGALQNPIRTGIRKIASLDVNDKGLIYALSEDSWLTVFYPNGGIETTAHLEPKVLALALVDGKPIVADEKDHLHFLEQAHPQLTLEAWPRPWKMFGIGPDRLAIWRPVGRTISLIQMEEDFSTMSLGQEEKYIAAAGDADMHLYLLCAETQTGSAQIREYDNHVRPGWIGRFALPEAFHPTMLGVFGNQIYLADVSGKVAVYPLTSPSEERVLADHSPELLTDLGRVNDAIRLTEYKGTVSIDLIVEKDGLPKAIQIHGPAFLSNHPELITAVQALRFRPKIQAGSPVASAMELHIGRSR